MIRPLRPRGALFALLLTLLLFAGCGGSGVGAGGETVEARGEWTLVSPESVGIDAAKLQAAEKKINEEYPGVRSVLVARQGRLALERYYGGASSSQLFDLHSVTKSVLSALIGIAVGRGELESLDTYLADVFPERIGEESDPRVSQITLRHLLTMASGYRETDAPPERDLVGLMLNRPLASAPGKQFAYDSGSSHLLSAVLAEATGVAADVYANRHLFEPLGIQPGEWLRDAEGVTVGSTGLDLTPRDLAKLGELYLRNGKWDGEQVVPAAYVRDSTKRHIGVGAPGRGYGYQWWTHAAGRASGYAALGFGGQAVAVFPKLDLVVVLTSDAGAGGEQSIGPILFDMIAPAVETD